VVRPPYRAALRLALLAATYWAEVDSAYASAPDILLLPPHRFLNRVFAYFVGRIDPEKREEWEMSLDAPLPGESAAAALPSPATVEAEGEAFMAAFGQFSGNN
jgi:hypothetical protein